MLLGSALVSASPLTVTSYDMLNGERHTFSYMDKSYNGSGNPAVMLSPLSNGKGLLTDGATGVSDFSADLGNGASYEWVGWALNGGPWPGVPADTNDVFATITFKLASAASINSISMFINNTDGTTPGVSGVGIFKTATVSFSNDNVNFVNPIVYASTAGDISNTNARFFTIALNQATPYQYVQVHLTHQAAENWVFLSEVTFDGSVVGAPSTPEPSSLILSFVGVLGLAWKFRRRKQVV